MYLMSWKIDAIVDSGMKGGEYDLPYRHFIDIKRCVFTESRNELPPVVVKFQVDGNF